MTTAANAAHRKPRLLTLTTQDDYVLGAIRYPARHAPLRGRIVVAGALGISQGFYRRFARFAATRGFETLTFDYRGIGHSRPPSLKGFRMDCLDWGRQDLAAAVDACAREDVPLYVLGHCYAGIAFGLLPNHHKVAGFYVFGAGTSWHGWMPPKERMHALALRGLVLPLLTAWKGYCPWKMLSSGEDLPMDVYRQCRRWCQFPHFFFDDPHMRGIEQHYARITTPIVAATSLDDTWALPPSRDALLKGYRNAPIIRKELQPTPATGKIGHVGYFRARSETLWSDVLNWFASLQP